MLLCLVFSRHIIPARKCLIALYLTSFAHYILLYHCILVTCADMLELCGSQDWMIPGFGFVSFKNQQGSSTILT